MMVDKVALTTPTPTSPPPPPLKEEFPKEQNNPQTVEENGGGGSQSCSGEQQLTTTADSPTTPTTTRIKEEPYTMMMDFDEEPKTPPQSLQPEAGEETDEPRTMHELSPDGNYTLGGGGRCQLSPTLEQQQLGAQQQADAAEHSLMKMQMRKYIYICETVSLPTPPPTGLIIIAIVSTIDHQRHIVSQRRP